MPTGYAHRDDDVPLTMGLGLYQGDKLGVPATQAYLDLLRDAFLPRVALRLESLMRQATTPEARYEVLKVYLMLFDPAHLEVSEVEALVGGDWQRNFPREVQAAEHEALRAHLRDRARAEAAADGVAGRQAARRGGARAAVQRVARPARLRTPEAARSGRGRTRLPGGACGRQLRPARAGPPQRHAADAEHPGDVHDHRLRQGLPRPCAGDGQAAGRRGSVGARSEVRQPGRQPRGHRAGRRPAAVPGRVHQGLRRTAARPDADAAGRSAGEHPLHHPAVGTGLAAEDAAGGDRTRDQAGDDREPLGGGDGVEGARQGDHLGQEHGGQAARRVRAAPRCRRP